jgi:hypothetical protein
MLRCRSLVVLGGLRDGLHAFLRAAVGGDHETLADVDVDEFGGFRGQQAAMRLGLAELAQGLLDGEELVVGAGHAENATALTPSCA